MQVSYPYDCSVFLREKSRALPNNVALSFIESINTFTGTFKMAHLYWILQLLKLLLYTRLHIHIFLQTNSRQKKYYCDRPFWDSIQIFFFNLKEQINLQQQSYGNCYNLAKIPDPLYNSHTLLWSPFMYIKNKCMCT